MRKKHVADFKAKVGSGGGSGGRHGRGAVPSRYEVHASQIHAWKKTLLAGVGSLFARGKTGGPNGTSAGEAQLAKLYETIGRADG